MLLLCSFYRGLCIDLLLLFGLISCLSFCAWLFSILSYKKLMNQSVKSSLKHVPVNVISFSPSPIVVDALYTLIVHRVARTRVLVIQYTICNVFILQDFSPTLYSFTVFHTIRKIVYICFTYNFSSLILS
jgi:hypothetical protein